MRTQIPRMRSDSELHEAVRGILPTGPQADIRVLDALLGKVAGSFGGEAYALFLELMFHVEVEPARAKQEWERMKKHHADLCARSGVAMDFRVTALDYLTRVTKTIANPTVIETDRYLDVCRDTVTDAMTGLFNLRCFNDALAREFARAERYRSQLSLLFFDIDHFKRLNDTCGHPAGDRVLKEVAAAIAHSVRSSDYPCRYGGEEFAVIAPETPKEGARLVAERVRSGVAGLEIPELDAARLGLSLSGGIACFPEDAASAEQLLERADQALYRAKEEGRDRVEIYTGERRRQRRVPAELTGACAVLPGRRVEIATKDLSEGGLLIESADPIPPGGVVNLEVSLPPGDEPVRCVAKVKYLRPAERRDRFEIGVAILQMVPADFGRYRRYLSDRLAA